MAMASGSAACWAKYGLFSHLRKLSSPHWTTEVQAGGVQRLDPGTVQPTNDDINKPSF